MLQIIRTSEPTAGMPRLFIRIVLPTTTTTSYLRDCFKANNVPVHLETAVSEIKADGVVITHKDGTAETVPADSVILSVGYNPAPLAKKGSHIHVIGDAQSVGNLRTVIWGAWDVCMKL